MNILRAFIKQLNSRVVEELLLDYYYENADAINSKYRDEKKFIAYLKAFYIEKFLSYPPELQRILIDQLQDGNLNTSVVENFIDVINGSEAKVEENIDGISLSDFIDLYAYRDDPIYDLLSEKDEYIFNLIRDINGFVTLDELKSGNYVFPDNYRLDSKEITMLEKSNLLREIINWAHINFDQYSDELDGRTLCNFDLIEDETIRSIVPHTNKDNPEIEIVLPDGTIVNYFKGDIRFYPLSFKALAEYIKLTFIDNYYNGDENPFLKMKLFNDGICLDDVNIDEMTREQFEILLTYATDMATDAIRSLTNIYSKKMISDAKDKVKTLKTLVYKYKL